MRIRLIVTLLVLGAASFAGGAPRSSASTPFVVSCADIIGGTSTPRADGRRLVLGVLSVPPEHVSDGTVDVGGRWRYWEKAGMVVRPGTFSVTVSVPQAWRSRAAITWGNSHPIVNALTFRGCGRGTYWNAYAGGFLLRVPSACVPLVFSMGHQSTTLRFGIGRRCR